MMQPGGGSLTASRLLLRRLRDVMAGGGTGQQRLDRIVSQIAAAMVAEVCSAYVRRAGDVLELFATQGLKPEAVHKTRLRVGEGLVGDVAAHARPLALADASSHPNFAYRPETGEEIYQSLMGVPILRGGRVLGVLVVQNRAQRHYTEEEIEALETIAMVVAELVAGGELIGADEIQRGEGAATGLERLEGIPLSPGLAIGAAVLHEPQIVLRQLVAEDPDRELERLREARALMSDALDSMLAAADIAGGGEHRDILETYKMFAEDRGWIGRISEAIRSGLTAEAAVQKVKNDTRARMAQVTDPYLHERLLDLDDLANRLLQHLSGAALTMVGGDVLADDIILVARTMGPAELLDYDRRRLRGVVLEEGSATAHVAIVARALDIPVIGRCANALIRVAPGDQLILDGDNGQLLIRPTEDVQQLFAGSMLVRRERQAMFAATRDLPPVTLSGERISLNINAGLLIDMPHLAESGADGVGLYRTEIPFMTRATFPDVANQTWLYRKVLEQAGDKPVIFRTLDVGGDKVLPYWSGVGEENPAMGWRAIRIALDRPAMLRQQLRALLAAAAGRPLHLMFPMIAEIAELEAARRILDLETERAAQCGAPLPSQVSVGAMFEVPSLAWQLPALLERVDFLSVGSNDLRQFLFASDRGNPRLAERYDTLSAPMLALLADLVSRADARGVPIGVCGAMASHPLEAMVLIGLGYRSLSLPPSAIGPVKLMVRSLEVPPLRRYLDGLLVRPQSHIRAQMRAYARDHDIAV